jgi:TalC/MipB family fructose-6-phosphate aldolase
MKIFLDTIDLENLKKFSNILNIYGVTTNPTLAKRFNMSDDIDMIKKIADNIGNKKEIHVEAFGGDEKEIRNNVYRISKNCKSINLVFKVPFTESGVQAVKNLILENFRTSLHIIYSANQAILASNVNSTYICPLIGRLDDIGHKASENLQQIKNSFIIHQSKTLIMGSSIRTPQNVMDSYAIGLDAVTIPLNVLELMFYHPLTSKGYESFERDLKSLSNISKLNINKNLILNQDKSLGEALSVLASQKAGAIAIVDKNKLAGIFTTGDLNRLIKTESKFSMNDKISKYMSKNPIAVDSNERIIDVVEIIKKTNLGQIIVLQDGQPFGVLDAKDIVKF